MGLKELRESRGLTQQELAERAGLTYQRISAYERGDNDPANMTLRVAVRLGKALGIRDLAQILDD